MASKQPVETLIELAKRFIQLKYDFMPLSITQFAHGIASVNFRAIGSNIDLVIRCDLRRSQEEVASDQIYQNAAKQFGTNVPSGPLQIDTLDGITITGRPTVEGNTLSEYEPVPLHIVSTSGQQLSFIHQATVKYSRLFFYEFVYDTNNHRWLDISRYAFKHPDSNISTLAKKLANLIQEQGTQFNPNNGYCLESLIHGDFTFRNIIVTPLDEVVVLDWEKATTGPKLFDLGRTLFHMLCYDGRKLDFGIVEAFVKGYNQRNPLNIPETRHISLAMTVAAGAFFLLDITFAAMNHAKPASDFDIRREHYFKTHCVPTYSQFASHETLIRKQIEKILLGTQV